MAVGTPTQGLSLGALPAASIDGRSRNQGPWRIATVTPRKQLNESKEANGLYVCS
ncbi:hypothetical protein MALV_13480 [Mycolicibacterium alvei]|uniref:Uncharacterized protein n=1 Tax=Mycolicibacterium alvei TaxID=67081 RepID=A0A6N4UQS6_9MYCO|nr:hypothetical protein MALV_13480 [Mycolicibacterium alvei]